jgi:hypothetical protein
MVARTRLGAVEARRSSHPVSAGDKLEQPRQKQAQREPEQDDEAGHRPKLPSR